MLRFKTLALCVLCLLPVSTIAQERVYLGYGGLLTNDFLGDGRDRWRSGSLVSSFTFGPADASARAPRFGEVIELRLGLEALGPRNLPRPAADDRPYAGILTAGVHTHFQRGKVELSIGGDLVFTGEGTGVGRLQKEFHEALGASAPSAATLAAQIDDGVHPTLVAEAAHPVVVAPALRVIPFVEGRAGVETLVRAGLDLSFGDFGFGGLTARDASTGHRYRTSRDPEAGGLSLTLGADIAHVTDSVLLPEGRGFTLTQTRDRVRAGVHWQGERASAFYGLTWLGKEFERQSDDQVVGSLSINLDF